MSDAAGDEARGLALRQSRTGLGAAGMATLLLAACGAADPRAAFVDSRPPPGLAERFYPPEGWAWGLVSTNGGPLQRYGVAGAAGVARGQVLILPDYGETAETWFETARDLGAAGYTVWILEGIGQGGSARLATARDLGHLQSFEADTASIRAMIDDVIQPAADAPVTLLGQGVGALVAARAVETGARPAGLIVSAPPCEQAGDGGLLRRLGLGATRAPGETGWRREGPDDLSDGRTHDIWRGAVTRAWQRANPDLRMGGPSLDWRAAFADLRHRTLAGLARLSAPTLVLETDRTSHCLEITGAERDEFAGAGAALELEDDRRRGPWLSVVLAFLARTPHRVPASAPVHVL